MTGRPRLPFLELALLVALGGVSGSTNTALAGNTDDSDGDGVFDPVDNCVLVANGLQRDSDGDGLGNFCDPDLNNDGIIDGLDLGLLRDRFFSTDADADFDGSGAVNAVDLGILKSFFTLPPGPNGTITWSSQSSGDWTDRLNWQPQIVPVAGTNAVIDVGGVTVTLSGGSATVKNLLVNDTLLLDSTTFEATEAIDLGGTLTLSSTVINRTRIDASSAGSGTVIVNSGSHDWSEVTVGVEAILNNGALVSSINGLTVNGTVTIDAPSSPTGFQFTESQTLGGSGTLILNAIGNNVITEPRIFPVNGTTLTIDSGVTIRGGNGTIGNVGANLILRGNLHADVSGDELVVGGASWSATGNLQATNSGEVRLFGALDNAGAALGLDGTDGVFSLSPGATLANAVFNGTVGTNLRVLAGATTMNSMTFNHDLTHANSALTNVAGGLTLNGTATIIAPSSPTGFQFTESQTLGGNGTVVINGAGNAIVSEPRLFPFTSTELTIGSGVTIRGGVGTVGQSFATLVVNGTISADTNNLNIRGSTVTNNGLLEALNGQTLLVDNLNSLQATLHVGAGSTISLSDPLALGASSAVNIDLSSAAQVGQIIANSGSASYAGTLTVSAVDGFAPTLGASFDLFFHSGFSGNFAIVNTVGLAMGRAFILTFSPTAGTVTVN